MNNLSVDDFWQNYTSFSFKDKSSGPDFLFRGVPKEKYKLIPSIGRDTEENTSGVIEGIEDDLLNEFKRLSAPVLGAEKAPKMDFDWLFLAQHYGLPTRLLDWSLNPLVALYFAVEKDDSDDAIVYAVRHMITDQYKLFDYKTANYKKEYHSVIAIQPKQGKIIFVRPKYSDERYLNQRSVFSCPSNPFEALELENMHLIKIKSDWKPELRERLRTVGISTSYIYPGLGGIASEIKAFVYDPVQAGRRKVLTVGMRKP